MFAAGAFCQMRSGESIQADVALHRFSFYHTSASTYIARF